MGWRRWLHVPLDLVDEIQDDALFGNAVDVGAGVLLFTAKDVVALAIRIIVRIINDFNEPVVAHAT